jgi:hypothetical protein
MPDTKVGIDIRPKAIRRVYVDFDPSDLRCGFSPSSRSNAETTIATRQTDAFFKCLLSILCRSMT